MKLEDLKLPSHDELYVIWDSAPSVDIALAGISHQVAKSVCNQLRAHYEADKQPAPEWRLPDLPPGRQWHRDDWTQDMLPEGYRPLLLGEVEQPDDEYFGLFTKTWYLSPCSDREGARPHNNHRRTRRPLPAPVEYVPLGPEDVPPGTVLRGAGEKQYAGWCMITSAKLTGIRIWRHSEANGYEMRWRDLMDSGAEILRPGNTTWEPCKKPKA